MDAEGRLERRRLFSLLDLDTPGMQNVRAALDAGDFVFAEEELLQYVRNRENVKPQIPLGTQVEHKGSHASNEDLAIAGAILKARPKPKPTGPTGPWAGEQGW